MQDVTKKLEVGRSGSQMNTARWPTATGLEICSASAKAADASDVPYGRVELFSNEPAQNTFTRFCKHDGLKGDEEIVLSKKELDAVITACIVSIESTSLEPCSFVDVEKDQLKEVVDLKLRRLQSRKRSFIEKNARRLKEHLASAVVNVLQH